MKELTLREIQNAELEILKEFDKICKENGLRYSLAGGTLLGAVRHKGFIPWDDDIDVCMPRPDYEKFKKVFQDNAQVFCGMEITDDCGASAIYPFLKMQRKDIVIFEEGFNEVQNLWIDIFPIDGLPEDIEKVKKIYKKSSFYGKVIVFSKWKNMSVYGGNRNWLSARLINLFVKMYGCGKAIRKTNKLAEKYPYDQSEYVGAITGGRYGIGERMVKAEYEQFTKMPFEDCEFSAMGCWNSYLGAIYGDYMQLPPEDKRQVHGFKAYLREEEE